VQLQASDLEALGGWVADNDRIVVPAAAEMFSKEIAASIDARGGLGRLTPGDAPWMTYSTISRPSRGWYGTRDMVVGVPLSCFQVALSILVLSMLIFGCDRVNCRRDVLVVVLLLTGSGGC
jgi:hypothetical protein